MTIEKTLYQAEARVTGGRDGRVTSSDKQLDLQLAMPKALGGPGGEGTNPEQLFAAGYSACFLSALKLVAGQAKVKLSDETHINAKVDIGPDGQGFGLAVTLAVTLPGLDEDDAKALVDKAHEVCPYSNATRGNIPVELEVYV
ncbi:MAG: organic hydroperoxide resistance protein [Alcanivorax sp.]|nr:organic hydroperoxide resistance protein [Alcanivorax sp.]